MTDNTWQTDDELVGQLFDGDTDDTTVSDASVDDKPETVVAETQEEVTGTDDKTTEEAKVTPPEETKAEEQARLSLDDPNSAPAEAQPYIKAFQAEYTRARQAIKPIEDFAEANSEWLDQVAQSQGLTSGIEAMTVVAKDYHDLMTDPLACKAYIESSLPVLREQGYEIDVAGGQQETVDTPSGDLSEYPPEIQQLFAEQKKVNDFLEQQKQQQLHQEQERLNNERLEAEKAKIEEEINSIKELPEFKSLDDDGWDVVKAYGLLNGKSFFESAQMLASKMEASHQQYLQTKKQQPKVAGGGGTTAKEVAKKPATWDDTVDLLFEDLKGE